MMFERAKNPSVSHEMVSDVDCAAVAYIIQTGDFDPIPFHIFYRYMLEKHDHADFTTQDLGDALVWAGWENVQCPRMANGIVNRRTGWRKKKDWQKKGAENVG